MSAPMKSGMNCGISPSRARLTYELLKPTLVFLSLCALALGGCTSSRAFPARNTMVKVWYSTGGSSPVVTELSMTNDNYLGLMTTHWENHSMQVDSSALAHLRRLLDSPELESALARSQPADAHYYASEERVLLTIHGREHLFLAGSLPKTIRTLLEAGDNLYTRTYGRRYSLRIPH